MTTLKESIIELGKKDGLMTKHEVMTATAKAVQQLKDIVYKKNMTGPGEFLDLVDEVFGKWD